MGQKKRGLVFFKATHFSLTEQDRTCRVGSQRQTGNTNKNRQTHKVCQLPSNRQRLKTSDGTHQDLSKEHVVCRCLVL